MYCALYMMDAKYLVLVLCWWLQFYFEGVMKSFRNFLRMAEKTKKKQKKNKQKNPKQNKTKKQKRNKVQNSFTFG